MCLCVCIIISNLLRVVWNGIFDEKTNITTSRCVFDVNEVITISPESMKSLNFTSHISYR